MASNFQIISFKNKESLHLRLSGDFDEHSAHDLINTLKKYNTDFLDIFIDTTDLKTVDPVGRFVFQKNLSGINKQLNNLIFVGANKYEIIPIHEEYLL